MTSLISRSLVAVATVAIAALMAGCAQPAQPSPPQESPSVVRTAAAGIDLPDPNAGFDYQLGGPYGVPEGVTVVARDRTAEPAGAGYDICYVNGFQTQPAESEGFARERRDLVLWNGDSPLIDPGWPDEYLFDTSTPEKRAALRDVVRPWIQECAHAGFDGVEIDNLDSYTRSGDALTLQNNLDMAAIYAEEAHRAGLAIAQKNTADQAGRLRALGYDFVIAESCYQFEECDAYTSVYPVVLDIEYTDELGEDGFAEACEDDARPASMILRDHSLVTPDDDEYVYRRCS